MRAGRRARSGACVLRILLTLGAACLLAVGCGGGDTPESDGAGASDRDHYCTLTAQLAAAGDAALGGGRTPARDQEAAVRRFAESQQAHLDQLEQVAPDAISDDVELRVKGLRGRAGLGPRVDPTAEEMAGRRVIKFERRHC